MFHTTATIEYRAGTAAVLPVILGTDTIVDEARERRTLAAEQALDQVLADSFPASDPPSWTPAIATPMAAVGVRRRTGVPGAIAESGERDASNVIDTSLSASAGRTLLQGLATLAGTAGLALLVPIAILIVGTPFALAVRGVLEAIGWFFGVSIR
jgi:hypothetical protein